MLDVATNAEEVAADLLGSVVEATSAADEEAGLLALSLIGPKTPRRSGRLAAGLRADVESTGGFRVVSEAPYGSVVDARTGFATETLLAAESQVAAVYDAHAQARFDTI